MKTFALLATAGVTLTLLSACGGGSYKTSAALSSPTPGSGSPSPSPATPSPSPSPGTLPKDYQLAYFSATQGIYTVNANAAGSAVRRSTALPLLSTQIYDGDWTNNVLVNSRPYLLVFLDGNRWQTLSLRSASAQAEASTGITEDRMVCPDTGGAFSIANYAAPDNSVITYVVAGTDNECGTSDDFYTGFRLGSTTVTDYGAQPSFRQFRSNTGALTGLLTQVGSELRLYAPGATSFTAVATGIVGDARNAAIYARSNSMVWMRWNNGSNKSIYRIDANGTVSSPLYSVPTADTLGGGYADANAMFITHRTSGSSDTEIVRVPYSGNSSVVATLLDNPLVIAATSTSLMLNSSDASGNSQYSVLPKAGGTPLNVALTGNDRDDFSPQVLTTSADQYLFNTYRGEGSSYASAALLVNAQGQVLENINNSEWIGSVGGALDLSRPTVATIGKAERIESYTGSLNSTGHQGGSVVVRDFTASTRTLLNVTIEPPVFVDALHFGLPVDLALLSNVDGSDTDIVSFDLDIPAVYGITNTPTERESFP